MRGKANSPDAMIDATVFTDVQLQIFDKAMLDLAANGSDGRYRRTARKGHFDALTIPVRSLASSQGLVGGSKARAAAA